MVRLPFLSNANKTLKGHKLILLATPLPPNYIDRLNRQFPDLKVYHRDMGWYGHKDTTDKIPDEEWRDVTVLLTGDCFPPADKMPKLQYVQVPSAGADSVITKPIFERKDIAFCTANGVHGPQIAEWVIMTFLAAQNHLPQFLQHQQQGKWIRPTELTNTEDSVGQRVGILGYGSIGRQVARLSSALGMSIHAYTRTPRDTPSSRKDNAYVPPSLGDPDGTFPSAWYSGTSKSDLHAFLASDLDLLVITMPLTDSTRRLIGPEELEILSRKRTFVSNISRGPIIDTDALRDALEGEKIRGAALDVTDPEPLPDGHALWKTKNLIITPHVSGVSKAYNTRLLDFLVQNLERMSEGKELANQIDGERGY